MSDSIDYFIFAGESSADLLGFHLMQDLLLENPQVKIQGVFGPKMRSLGFKCLLPSEDFQVMGFIDVLKHLKPLIRHFYFLKKHLLKTPPRQLILIDYPGFNLQLAKCLKQANFPSKIIQYVCPSIWAWKPRRVHFLKRWIDEVWCLFPFEPLYLEKANIQSRYVGHPLAKALDFPKISLQERGPLILVFPGSRQSVIQRNLPLQIEAALSSPQEYKIGISAASTDCARSIEKILLNYPPHRIFIFSSNENYMLMEQATFALATSGTITLELALHHVPTFVCYHISRLDYWMAKYVFNIYLPFYCIVNFLCLEEIFPEFYGPNISKEILTKKMEQILTSQENLEAMYKKTFVIEKLLKSI
jgi:lipid-A-disaccharide synthase